MYSLQLQQFMKFLQFFKFDPNLLKIKLNLMNFILLGKVLFIYLNDYLEGQN